jgi:NDP-sugar pyrophosphorylase family protein
VVELDSAGRVVRFDEKPPEPRSTLVSPAFYFLTAASLGRLPEYLGEPGLSRDAPGHFIAWLCGQEEVYGALLPGSRIDIGCLSDYEAVR